MDEPKDNQKSDFDKFKDFARKIVRVPKSEADAVEAKNKRRSKRKGRVKTTHRAH